MTIAAAEYCVHTSVILPLRRLLRMLRRPSHELPSGGIEEVAAWLYARWYCDCGQAPAASPPVVGREELVSALRVAMAAAERWDSGWVAMQAAPNGRCVAGRRDVTRVLLPGRYVNLSRPGLAALPGDGLAVNELVDWTDAATGFWHAQSSTGEPIDRLVRVYWNVGWDQVGYVLRDLSAALDGIAARYSLKCASRAAGFGRVDSLVVYVERAHWATIEPLVEHLALALEHRLRPPTPPLTRIIGAGAAWAEDPGSALSYGQSRCSALAPGVCELLGRDGWSDDDGLEVLVNALVTAGVAPHQPWLMASA